MYTTVPRQEVVEHRPRPGEPALEIIDHREQPQHNRSKKKRPEQLPYESLKTQRDTLFKQELVYKKRIEELEKDSKELLKSYESTYEENVKLKRILDNGPDAVKMKQMTKEKKEQKGMIDQLKDENQSLAEKLSELEKEVQVEKLKAHERGWDAQLSKVKKKRQEEDSIPTEGPFVAGRIAKPKRMMLHDEDGSERQIDAYDLEVDSLEKETQVLLNKVKILKREKEQIDYATLMGKGAVTKNKTVAKAINDKLNKDLNKFVMRLQMLKMKQNAARTYFSMVTDESNPIIQVKQTNVNSGKNSPDQTDKGNSSNRSWKRQNGGSEQSSRNDGKLSKVTSPSVKPLGNAKTVEISSIFSNTKGKLNSPSSKSPSIKSGKGSRKQSVAESETSLRANIKSKIDSHRRSGKSTPEDNDAHVEVQSANIWRRVQSNKLSGRMRAEARDSNKTANTDNDKKDKQDNNKHVNFKPVLRGVPSKQGTTTDTTKVNKEEKSSKNKGKDAESTGRYTHGPEPIGFKPKSQKDSKSNVVQTKPFSTNTSRFHMKQNNAVQPLYGETDDKEFVHSHSHGKTYRINGIDDGFSMIRLHNHVKEMDKKDKINPIPINFKTRRSLDVREGRSIIGNSGIRQDAFYRINDQDPYFGL